ncbi:hypothetical protein WS89_22635 [Burkholderia sp. MSMB1072]|uniref:hypothetical protein n=1 Tax=Burkholderia sp. MSMB1072 TaxID=1637871 RepID=UPI000756D198|nr:hypothetical protein [Burkholderia sp. MSMB1072]KVH56778.1 hypothetical protein WS89_22635 [Burkholderia sp. MSMB1072]
MTTTDYTSQAQAIAEALVGVATPTSLNCPNDNFYVSLPGRDPDAQILLRFSPYRAKDRLVVTPSFNQLGQSRRGHIAAAGSYLQKSQLEQIGYVSEITIALTKSAGQVAADIARRLLPGYLSALSLVRAELKKEADEEAQRDAAMQKFAGIVGECWTPDSRDNRRLHLRRMNTPAGYSATLELHTNRECSLDIRWVSAELAEKILTVLAQHGEAKE